MSSPRHARGADLPSRNGRIAAALVGCLALVASVTMAPGHAGAAPSGDHVQGRGLASQYRATIRWTAGMVPNISGATLGDVTFGQGWASATTRPCDLVDALVKLRGERSRYFGPGAGDANITSDVGWRAIGIDAIAARDWPTVSADVRSAMVAFAAGWNAHLAQVGSRGLSGWCAGAEWVRPVQPSEVYLVARGVALFASSSQVVEYVAGAEPPVAGRAAPPASSTPSDVSFEPRTGSNGWAIGSERTAGSSGGLGGAGGGGLLMNPHLAWDGELRWSEVHLTVPGQLNIYGAQLAGIPGVGMGFTDRFGWAHTTASGNRFTFYTLKLVPGSPTSYRYGDQVREMTPQVITIQVRNADGTLRPVTRTRWRTHYGPILSVPGLLPWTATQAVAIRDANIDNDEFAEQYTAAVSARSLDEFIGIQRRYQGQPAFNTLAVSSDGRAWFGDTSATPNLSSEALAIYEQKLATDPFTRVAYDRRVVLLDGSDPRFEWQDSPGARDPGLVPFSRMPVTERRDYLFNANDSYWMTNVEHRLEGDYSLLFGRTGTEQSPRTRQNAATLADTSPTGPAGADGRFDVDELAAAALDNRSFTGEALKGAVVERCRRTPRQAVSAVPAVPGGVGLPAATVDLTDACSVLDRWNGRFDVDSVGAVLWREFSSQGGVRWARPFDPADPQGTPSGLAPAPASGSDPALVSLARAVQALQLAGYPVDVPLGTVQLAVRNGVRVAVSGGQEGITNAIGWGGVPTPTSLDPAGRRLRRADFAPGSALGRVTGAATFTGYPVNNGSSFILALVYGRSGPKAKVLLAYGNTSDETAPEFVDATRRFGTKSWRDVPFTAAQVTAAQTSVLTVRGSG